MIRYYNDIEQGGEEWLALRRGILTASEMRLIMTPTMRPASNDKERAHLFELLGQRITGYTEPHYISDDMLRGHEDEVAARIRYAEHFAPVTECGFVTNDDHGVVIGYSPDGLVGDDGLIECKSRRQKYQIETILADEVPAEYLLQCQTGLLVTGRKWLDFVSYCGGLPMVVKRVWPCPEIQQAIIAAASAFEQRLAAAQARYAEWLARQPVIIHTERTIEQEIMI
ncbi:MAG TPA: YqaJ viral recombinase family protein [Accumulibacter sp.]|uniref:lambda exonuclease family protein n=1 Tax=Accumulibacter sp. TaxID=2053492 RepID=UPI002C973F48|nr:YqaJ viral recombinase family protein [Accumulibacter sp.]HNL98677.1 YqaJ viral recombinase family protein [Accumulibacter sp.]